MVLFGRDLRQRRVAGGSFPCPRCGDRRACDEVISKPCLRVFGVRVMPLGRSVASMRCRTCAAFYRPTIDEQPDLRLVADWNHRVARLVATVGVAACTDRSAARPAARAFLLDRGWFTAEVDGAVGWASELSDGATSAVVDELVAALEALRSMTRPSGMDQIVAELAWLLAAGGPIEGSSARILVRCGAAAGLDGVRIEQLVGDSRTAVAA